jgi:hypothetical protein
MGSFEISYRSYLIIHRGELQRPGTRTRFLVDTHAILFDHYLVLAKIFTSFFMSGRNCSLDANSIRSAFLFISPTLLSHSSAPGTRTRFLVDTHAILFDHYLVLAKIFTMRDRAVKYAPSSCPVVIAAWMPIPSGRPSCSSLQLCCHTPAPRLSWDTFLKAPITRIQRYTLLLATVHKNMVKDSEEKANLAQAIDIPAKAI